jgi:hypothetical protein
MKNEGVRNGQNKFFGRPIPQAASMLLASDGLRPAKEEKSD